MKVIEWIFHLKFQIVGNQLSEENGNKLIKKFREILDSFKLDKPPMKASVVYPFNIDYDGAEWSSPNLVVGSYSNIRINIIDDAPEPEATVRFNNVTRAEVAQALGAIEVKRYNAVLRVSRVNYN